MSVNSVITSLDETRSVRLWTMRRGESALLVLEPRGTHFEITMDRAQVEELGDQSGRAEAADAAVRAFGSATVEADHATETPHYATIEAEAVLSRLRPGDHHPERAESGVR